MRKAVFSVILTGALVLGLTACSGNGGSGAGTAAQTTSAAVQTTESQASARAGEESSTLIAYFSWSGNTKILAGLIQEQTGGDLFEITPAVPYTEDYDALLDQAQEEQGENARPELAGQVENWDDYDVVFVGYPNWWSDTPMAVLTFLESYDFDGKKLVPFCTHGSGGFGRSLSSVEQSAQRAEILEGFEISGASAAGAGTQIEEWLTSIGMVQ